MPNDPYLDASVAWRIRAKQIEFREADYRTTVEEILTSGLATHVEALISAGKEADVYLAHYKDAWLAVKVYRLYRTYHRGRGTIMLDAAGRLAAHEYDMLLQAWKGGALVPTPARRVENMFSMRYLGDGSGHAPRLQNVHLERPDEMLHMILDQVELLAKAGVVHTDLSAYNILVFQGRPWTIDLSEALRVDRTGYSPWMRLEEAEKALNRGLSSLQTYFHRYDLEVEKEVYISRIVTSLDRFGVRS